MQNDSEIPRIWGDFNNCDGRGRLRLTTVGARQDLERLGLQLCEGMQIIVGCFELEADGIVRYSAEDEAWVAEIDWKKIRELPGNSVP